MLPYVFSYMIFREGVGLTAIYGHFQSGMPYSLSILCYVMIFKKKNLASTFYDDYVHVT